MAKQVAIGVQSYSKLIENGSFYIDKTGFTRDWWSNGDDATLLTMSQGDGFGGTF